MEVHAEVKCQNSAKSENCEKEVESIHHSKDVGVALEKPPKAIQTEISKSEPHSSTASCKKSEGHQIECSPSVDVWKCKENGNTHTQKTGNSVKEFEVTVSAANPSCDPFYFIIYDRTYFSNSYHRFPCDSRPRKQPQTRCSVLKQ